jgi:alpha/beta superfamily hydrolase
VQRFQHSKREEFIALEKEFAQLEHRGILPRGERLIPIAGREPGNTIVWQRRFESVAEAEAALKLFETNPEHTELANQQKHFFEGTWVELYEIVDW